MTLRISFTCPEHLADRLKEYANVYAQGKEERNVSKILCNLIEKYVPVVVEPNG